MNYLYKINENLVAILSELEDIALSPELSEEQKEQQIEIIMMKYDAIEVVKKDKSLNLVRAYKNSLSIATQINDEIKSLQKRKKAHQSRANGIKDFLSRIVTTGEQYEDATAKISWRKSESVWFDEVHINKLPEETLKIETRVNKTNLKKWIKENGSNEYCRIDTNQNIQLK